MCVVVIDGDAGAESDISAREDISGRDKVFGGVSFKRKGSSFY